GLAERLEAEKARPQADVWWSNEIFHTIRLASDGVLAPYDSPSAATIPAQFKDSNHLWAATALRARVIAVSTKDPILNLTTHIRSLRDLTQGFLKGEIVMADPVAGTTGGHVAALYTLWGKERADQFFSQLKAHGVRLVGGNSVVAQLVGDGTLLAGLTDNDDV